MTGRPSFIWQFAALWLFASALLIWSCWSQITTLSGWDPDDQLRLVQLRDFLAGQSWFDTTQYRMNAPEGAPMHWSRATELPLAVLVLVFQPLFGQPVAEMIAGATVPLLLLGGIAYLLSRIATRLAGPEAGIIAALLTVISPALLIQLRPMRIDHHGWQIFFAVVALSTIFWPDKKRGGFVLGVALALWLHISLEGAPVTAAFFLLLGWRWVVERAQGQRLAWTIASFAGASLMLFIGTQPDWLAVYCDSVSLPHIVAIVTASAIMLPAIATAPDRRRLRLTAALAAGVVAVAAILLTAPQCATGAFGGLDPLVREYWYVNINEGLPVWRQDVDAALVLMATSICGIAALLLARPQPGDAAASEWRIVGFFLIYATLLSLLVFRTVAVAAAFAIPLIAAWIYRLFQNYRCATVPVRRICLVVFMLFLLIPGPLVAQLYSIGGAAFVKPKSAPAKPDNANACASTTSVAALSALPAARFVAPFDMGPTILLMTPHQVLASSHHRNDAAMHDHIEIFRSTPATARRVIQRKGITHIAACLGESELAMYEREDPTGLWAQLAKGNVPAWLQPLPDVGKHIKVWRVR